MNVSAELVSQVHRDLSALVARPELVAELHAILTERDPAERRRLAFALASQQVGLRSLGELASREGEARDDLLRLSVDDEVARKLVRRWLAVSTRPTVFRALAHALPFSFRLAPSPALAEHVEALGAALNDPIWPEVPVSLSQLFVEPSLRGGEGRAPSEAFSTIRALLVGDPGRVVFITGPSGVGKSSLARVIAGREARVWGYVPVLLHAADFVRGREGDGSATQLLREVGAAGPLLVLVDGLDELSSSSERIDALSHLTSLLRQAEDTRAIVFGRGTRDRSVELLTQSSPRLELLPFDLERAERWGERWMEATSKRFVVTRFIDDDATASGDFVTGYPVTLFILAVTELQGRRLPTLRTDRGRAKLYRLVLDQLAERGAESDAKTHRLVMRAAALLSSASVRREASTSSVLAWFSATERSAVVTQVLSRFPMTQGRFGVRFVHAAIRDHLVAEQYAASIWRLLAFVRETSSSGLTASADEAALTSAWVRAMGYAPIDLYVAAPLKQMLPDWPAFESDNKRKKRERAGTSSSIRAALQVAYRWLIEDRAAESVVEAARAWGQRPRRVAATALFNVFAVAHCIGDPGAGWLAPERLVPGSLATAWHFIAAELDISDEMRALMFERLVLHGLRADSVQRLALPPIDLRDADLRDANFSMATIRVLDLRDATLSGAMFLHARVEWVTLIDAKLDRLRALGAHFVNCDLRRANLRGAQLRNARFVYCDLGDADFTGADLRGCTFKASNVEGARFDDGQLDDGALDHCTPSADELASV